MRYFFAGNLHRIVNGFYTKQDIEESNTIAIKKWNTRVYPGDETAEYFILPKPKEALTEHFNTIEMSDNGKVSITEHINVIQSALDNWRKEMDAKIQEKLFEAFRPTCERESISGETYLFRCGKCGEIIIDDDNFCPICGAKVVEHEQA